MERNAIVIKNLTKEINKVKALDNISLTIHAGEIAGLAGPKASGKSLITRALVNLVKVDSGEISFFDHNIKKERDYIMNFVGYKPKEFVPFKNMTIKDYFKYSSKFYQGDYTNKIDELIDYFHLDKMKKLKALSGEDLNIIGIIDSLYFDPEVIIMDEVFNNLSHDNSSLVISLLYSLKKRGRAIFVTSSNLHDLEFTDKKYLIKNGKLLNEDDVKKANKNYKSIIVKTKSIIKQEVLLKDSIKQLVLDDTRASFIFQGNLNDLIKILEKLDILDLEIDGPSLLEIYNVL